MTDLIPATRTNADAVFEALYERIVSLDVLPGTKLSEAEIARQYDLSRQPIRLAFSRLANMGLIRIRPQRPTIVRHLSMATIRQARFVRAAVEIEVLRLACRDRDVQFDEAIRDCLDSQVSALKAGDADAFHRLDYDFHRLLCRSARAEFAFETIAAKKAETDRLCLLGLMSHKTMQALLDDHLEIFAGVCAQDAPAVDDIIRRHLERLTPAIDEIYKTHRAYFVDD